MAYPTDLPPNPPQLHDGADSLTMADLQSVDDTLSAIQTLVGERKSTDTCNGLTADAVGKMFRDTCRIATGRFVGDYAGTPSSSSIFEHWSNYKVYFLPDESSKLFTKPPFIFFSASTALFDPTAVTNALETLGAFYTLKSTTSYFLPYSRETVSHFDVSWLAIEPVGEVDTIDVELI